eukprot:9738022-Alexandrium_andersonii.AAC.1
MARHPPDLPWRGRKCQASPPHHLAASAPAPCPCRGRPNRLRSGLARRRPGQVAPPQRAWRRAPGGRRPPRPWPRPGSQRRQVASRWTCRPAPGRFPRGRQAPARRLPEGA